MRLKPIHFKKRALWRLAVPVALVCAGVWLLVGCVYLPVPERRMDPGQKDFRDLVGDPGSGRPLRPGVVSRHQVVAALGFPPYRSSDGRAVGYVLLTQRAVWLYPLCFNARTATQRLYGLRLVFDEQDRLTGWKLIHVDHDLHWLIPSPGDPWAVISVLNDAHDGPELKGPGDPRPTTSDPETRP